MFPSLHEAVVNAVARSMISPSFYDGENDADANNEYQTHVMGKFRCKNKAYSTRGWGSKKVAILIRGYAGNGYNAEVFNQRCKTCDTLGTLTLDQKSYVERVAYRIQKWAGVRMEQPYYASKKGLPHKSELCEGCTPVRRTSRKSMRDDELVQVGLG